MNYIKTTLILFLLAAFGAVGMACSDDDDNSSDSKQLSNIVETAVGAGDFSTLVAAVQAADLVSALSGPGPFTVFAPSDAAFEKLPAGTVETLLQPENKDTLISILKLHVVSGSVYAKDVSAGTVQSLGGPINISIEGGSVFVDAGAGAAKVVATDIEASNGVIHVLDTVILPPM